MTTGKAEAMTETYGRTDMHYCGCTEDADGYVTMLCARHRDLELPEDSDGTEPWVGYPYEVPKPGGPQCEADGTREGPNGGDHYWSCTAPGTVDVDGTLMCEDHAGERGYGPKQEEYGFDPHDGHNPTPVNGG